MIKIKAPELLKEDGQVIVSSEFESEEISEVLWYKLSAKYEKYLVTENLDAFLVGLLFLGLRTGQDITLQGPISERLFYTLKHYLIPALCLAHKDYKEIKIFPQGLNDENMNSAKVAGTGLSCGVDSFATFFDHINDNGSFKIDFFTFFNTGSHGPGGEKTREIFLRRFEKAKKFADSIGKEIMLIDSNLAEVLDMKFEPTHSMRNVSCVLLLQKLFRNYYYASAHKFNYFKLSSKTTADSDILNLNMLSTESTHVFSSVIQYSRTERTRLISNFSETYDFLDVCTSPANRERGKNCTKCKKCLRTALTLDLYGKLHLYENVFDLERYSKYKYSYIGYIWATRNENNFSKELYDLVKQKGELKMSEIIFSKLKNRIRQ